MGGRLELRAEVAGGNLTRRRRQDQGRQRPGHPLFGCSRKGKTSAMATRGHQRVRHEMNQRRDAHVISCLDLARLWCQLSR